MNRTVGRLGYAAGAAFVVCVLVGNGITESGVPLDDTPAAAREYLALQQQASHRFAIGLELLGFCLLLVFLARLHAALRRLEGEDAWLSGLVLTGGITTVAVKVASFAGTVVGLSVDDLTPEQAQMVVRLNDAAFLLSAATTGVLVAGAAAACLAVGLLPRWLGVAGLVVGLLAVFGSLAPSSLDGGPGVPGFLLGLLWLGAVSILLAVRDGSRAPLGREAVLAGA